MRTKAVKYSEQHVTTGRYVRARVPLLILIRKYGNEERDRRLEVVKRLTSLIFCAVGGSFSFEI